MMARQEQPVVQDLPEPQAPQEERDLRVLLVHQELKAQQEIRGVKEQPDLLDPPALPEQEAKPEIQVQRDLLVIPA